MNPQKMTLRLSPALYQQVKDAADARGMSLNDWINHSIRASLSGPRGLKVVETITSERVDL